MRIVRLFLCLAAMSALGSAAPCNAVTPNPPSATGSVLAGATVVTTTVQAESSGEAIIKAQGRYSGYSVIDIKRASVNSRMWIVRLRKN